MTGILPSPVHQTVQLQVNPRRRTWSGRTELKVAVAPGQQTVGLHSYNLAIQQVTVDGAVAEFTLQQYPSEALPDLTVEQLRKGTGSISSLSEHAYDQYVRLMQREQEPELIITLPPQPLQRSAATPAGENGAPAVQTAADGEATPGVKSSTPGPVQGGTAAAAAAAEAAATVSGASPTPNKQQQTQQPSGTPEKQQQQQRVIAISFSKPPCSSSTDSSLLCQGNCMVANPHLRRARGWFPCIDSPLYIYSPGAPHCLPYTFDLHITVPPSFMAVCSGQLMQQTCMVAPVPGTDSSTTAVAATQAGTTSSSNGNGAGSNGTKVVARTYEYAVTAPVMPCQISIAVGAFGVLPYSEMLAAAGAATAAVQPGGPIVTVFALRDGSTGSSNSSSSSSSGAAAPAAQQGPTISSKSNAAAAGGISAARAAGGGSSSNSGIGGLTQGLSLSQLQMLADTLKPLVVLLNTYDKVLKCFPWSHLQVAVVPEGTLMSPYQVGMGCILISESLLVRDSLLLEPRLASVTALAAALATQYFGILLLPNGPGDGWLLRGLAGWLEGLGLSTLLGKNEMLYRRWQERVALSLVDDGDQLGPLSPVIRSGDRGVTAAWGRLHGTQDLEPCCALGWKATAVIQMLEKRIAEDEMRRTMDRLVNAAKAAAQGPHAPADITAAAPPTPAKPTASAAAPTVSGSAPPAGPAVAAAAAASGGPAAGAAGGGGLALRLMSTGKFMKQMGKKQGFKKEAQGFFDRWVHGTGMPRLTAGVTWDPRRSTLQFALRQSGSKAVRRGALKAAELPPGVQAAAMQQQGLVGEGFVPGAQAAAVPMCQLKVQVRELDVLEEHPLQVSATDAISLHELKVTSKLGEQRRRQQRAVSKTGRGVVSGAAEELDVSEAELRGVPVLWLTVDHGMEWLAAVTLRQPAHWWALQLEHSKDVVAQAQAVAGLSGQLGLTSKAMDDYIVSLLAEVMKNPAVFCRVRVDAALALARATAVCRGNRPLQELVNYTRTRLYDPMTGLLRPNNFSDLGEALLSQALPAALATVRDPSGYTPAPVLELLLDLLACNDNSSSSMDDGHWLAGLVAALGQLKVSNTADLARVLHELDRQLLHEAVVGTHTAVLGSACLTAATNLAVNLQHPSAAAVLDQVAQLLLTYASSSTAAAAAASAAPGFSNSAAAAVASAGAAAAGVRHMKGTAYSCLLKIAAARSEAELRALAAAIEAAAAAAAAASAQLAPAAAAGDNMDVGQQQQQQHQPEQVAADATLLSQQQQQQHEQQYNMAVQPATDAVQAVHSAALYASYSQLLYQLLAYKPPLLLDAVLGTALQLLDLESCPVMRASILKEALLLVGQLEQQGYYELKPDALLPEGMVAAVAAQAAAAAAMQAAEAAAAAAAAAAATKAGQAAAAAATAAATPVVDDAVPATPAAPTTPAAPAAGDTSVGDGGAAADAAPAALASPAAAAAAGDTSVGAAAAAPAAPAPAAAAAAQPDGPSAADTAAAQATTAAAAAAALPAMGTAASAGQTDSAALPAPQPPPAAAAAAEVVLCGTSAAAFAEGLDPAAAAASAADVAAAAADPTAAATASVVVHDYNSNAPDTTAAAAATIGSSDLNVVVPVSLETLVLLQRLVWRHGEPAVRQLAFMVLQKLAGQPATLYRERVEEEEEAAAAAAAAGPAATAAATPQAARPAASGGAAPSGSQRTGLTGRTRPAASAGGMSLNQTGTTNAPTKLKLSLGKVKKLPLAGAPSTATTVTATTLSSVGAAMSQQQQQQQQGSAQTAVGAAAAAAVPAALDTSQQPQQQQQQQQAAEASGQQQQQPMKPEQMGSLPPLPPPPAAAAATQVTSQQQQAQQQPIAAVPAAAVVAARAASPFAAAAGAPLQYTEAEPAAAVAQGMPASTSKAAAAAVPPPPAAAAPLAAAAAAVPPAMTAGGLPRGRNITKLKRSLPAAPAAAAAGGGGAPVGQPSQVQAAAAPAAAPGFPAAAAAAAGGPGQQVSGVKRPAASPTPPAAVAAAAGITESSVRSSATVPVAGVPSKSFKKLKVKAPAPPPAAAAATTTTTAPPQPHVVAGHPGAAAAAAPSSVGLNTRPQQQQPQQQLPAPAAPPPAAAAGGVAAFPSSAPSASMGPAPSASNVSGAPVGKKLKIKFKKS